MDYQLTPILYSPPAIVQVAFDEQRLKFEWEAACADEHDAVSRKEAVLKAALLQWPRVPHPNPRFAAAGKTAYHPEFRRFVRDVLGLPDEKDGGVNRQAANLASSKRAQRSTNTVAAGKRDRVIRRAVVELVTKYKLGADPAECMRALADYYEGLTK